MFKITSRPGKLNFHANDRFWGGILVSKDLVISRKPFPIIGAASQTEPVRWSKNVR
jgi:hypothetical protein